MLNSEPEARPTFSQLLLRVEGDKNGMGESVLYMPITNEVKTHKTIIDRLEQTNPQRGTVNPAVNSLYREKEREGNGKGFNNQNVLFSQDIP